MPLWLRTESNLDNPWGYPPDFNDFNWRKLLLLQISSAPDGFQGDSKAKTFESFLSGKRMQVYKLPLSSLVRRRSHKVLSTMRRLFKTSNTHVSDAPVNTVGATTARPGHIRVGKVSVALYSSRLLIQTKGTQVTRVLQCCSS